MPRHDYKTCRVCRRPSTEVGELSHTRLCMDCGDVRRRENNLGIAYKSGPAFVRWRRQMAASVGAVLISDLDTITASGNSQP